MKLYIYGYLPRAVVPALAAEEREDKSPPPERLATQPPFT
jgi:hypothetical protein